MSSSAIEEEEEILLSIFPEEFEKLTDDTFKIRLDPDSSNEQTIPPTLFLTAQLPPTYPDVLPTLQIDTIPAADGTDLTADDKSLLLHKLQETGQESLGMAMIFTLVSTLREEVQGLLDARQAAAEEAHLARQAAVMAEEQKRFEGTKVTRDSFHAWNAKFKMEQARKAAAEEEEVLKKMQRPQERKLTGRQLFEGDTTLAQSDLKIGDASDVEFDFSKFDRTTRRRADEEDDGVEEEEEEEVRHWAAEMI